MLSNEFASFSEMYENYFPILRRVAMKEKVPSRDADDIVQDTFMAYLKNYYPQREPEWRKKALLTRIVKNKSKNYVRDHARIEYESMDLLADYIDESMNLWYYEALSEKSRKVRRIVRSLKPEYRNVLILRYVEERSTEEICEILGISRSVYYNRLHRAKFKLKKLFFEKVIDFILLMCLLSVR